MRSKNRKLTKNFAIPKIEAFLSSARSFFNPKCKRQLRKCLVQPGNTAIITLAKYNSRTLPVGYAPGKVELGKVQSLADVSSLEYLNEGSGENEENSASISITLTDELIIDLTETKLTTKYSSTTVETTTEKKHAAKGRKTSRKSHRKGHRQHEITTKSTTTTSPSVEAESEFALISTSFESESSIDDSENNIIEPFVVPVNMEMHGPDQSMNMNEVITKIIFLKN